MYKATIYFDAEENVYEDGCKGNTGSSADKVITRLGVETVTAKTKKKLREEIELVTRNKWQDIRQEDINDYKHAREYWGGYLANANNYKANKKEIANWKKGLLQLWYVQTHILVSKVTETPVLV